MTKFVSKVDDAIVKSFISVEKKFTGISRHVLSNSYNTYHLFLVDFIVACDGIPKLIVINTLQKFKNERFTDNHCVALRGETLNIAGYHLPPTNTRAFVPRHAAV